MNLTYSEMVEALAMMNSIEPSEIGAFRAKLRKLQGEGIPGDVNPGKGRRVSYTVPLLVEAAVAVELLQIGWSPPQAAELVRFYRNEIFLASLLAIVPNQRARTDVLMLISPEALRTRSIVTTGAISFVSRRRLADLFGKGANVDPATGDIWRWSIIDLTMATFILMSCLSTTRPHDDVLSAFREAILENGEAVREFGKTKLNVISGEKKRGGKNGEHP